MARDPHIGHGMDQGGQNAVPAVAGLFSPQHMGFDLYFGPTQRGQHDHRQQFPPGLVQTVAAGEVPEAELGEEPGNRLGIFGGRSP